MNSKKFLKEIALAITLSFVLTSISQSALAVEKHEHVKRSNSEVMQNDKKENNTDEKTSNEKKEQNIETKDNLAKINDNSEENKLELKYSNSKENIEDKNKKQLKDEKNNDDIKSKERILENNIGDKDRKENQIKQKASITENKTENEGPGIVVSKNLLSLTEVREVEIKATFNKQVELKNLIWTYGGKTFDKWKKWNDNESKFSGEPSYLL